MAKIFHLGSSTNTKNGYPKYYNTTLLNTVIKYPTENMELFGGPKPAGNMRNSLS